MPVLGNCTGLYELMKGKGKGRCVEVVIGNSATKVKQQNKNGNAIDAVQQYCTVHTVTDRLLITTFHPL